MTTLRIEVGRHSGTTVEDVVEGLRRAGCMKYVEIDPDAYQYIPIEELKAALEDDLFQVELRPEPSPPPLPWWRRVRGWPHRIYNWLRRVFLREKEIDQFARDLMKAYEPTDAIHAMATRESPLMALMRKPDEDPDGAESFILRGRGTRHRDDEALAREREARIDAACEKVAPWWTPPEP